MSYVPNEKRYGGVEFRRCGQSGLELPPISLGTWQNFGGISVRRSTNSLKMAASISGEKSHFFRFGSSITVIWIEL
jgi:hypothetical protein